MPEFYSFANYSVLFIRDFVTRYPANMEDHTANIPTADKNSLDQDHQNQQFNVSVKAGVPGATNGINRRGKHPDQPRRLVIVTVASLFLLAILIVNVYEPLAAGGWMTLFLAVGLILTIKRVKHHYSKVDRQMERLDEILEEIPATGPDTPTAFDPKASTAVLMVKEYNGLGIHSLLSIPRLFPGVFKNVVFLSVVEADPNKLEGTQEREKLRGERKEDLERYAKLAHQLGFGSAYQMAVGADIIEEMEKLSGQAAKECPRAVFFTGKLVFEQDRWYRRILHNETAYAIQRRLQFDALNCMVLPIRVFASQKA